MIACKIAKFQRTQSLQHSLNGWKWELPVDYDIEERHAELGPYVWSKNRPQLYHKDTELFIILSCTHLSLLSSIYPLPAIHSLIVTVYVAEYLISNITSVIK